MYELRKPVTFISRRCYGNAANRSIVRTLIWKTLSGKIKCILISFSLNILKLLVIGEYHGSTYQLLC